jgi:hypothetical protein
MLPATRVQLGAGKSFLANPLDNNGKLHGRQLNSYKPVVRSCKSRLK